MHAVMSLSDSITRGHDAELDRRPTGLEDALFHVVRDKVKVVVTRYNPVPRVRDTYKRLRIATAIERAMVRPRSVAALGESSAITVAPSSLLGLRFSLPR